MRWMFHSSEGITHTSHWKLDFCYSRSIHALSFENFYSELYLTDYQLVDILDSTKIVTEILITFQACKGNSLIFIVSGFENFCTRDMTQQGSILTHLKRKLMKIAIHFPFGYKIYFWRLSSMSRENDSFMYTLGITRVKIFFLTEVDSVYFNVC